jgi:hypothetical protein
MSPPQRNTLPVWLVGLMGLGFVGIAICIAMVIFV